MNNYAKTLESYIITQEDMEYASEGIMSTIKKGIIAFFKFIIEKIGNLIQNIRKIMGIIRNKMRRKGKDNPKAELPNKEDVDSGNLPIAAKGDAISNTGATAARTAGSTIAKKANRISSNTSSNNSQTKAKPESVLPSKADTTSGNSRKKTNSSEASAKLFDAVIFFMQYRYYAVEHIQIVQNGLDRAITVGVGKLNDVQKYISLKITDEGIKFADEIRTHIDNAKNAEVEGYKAETFEKVQKIYDTLSKELVKAQNVFKKKLNEFSKAVSNYNDKIGTIEGDPANNNSMEWLNEYRDSCTAYIETTTLYITLGMTVLSKMYVK